MSTDITPYRNASLDEKRQYVQTLAAAGELLPKGLWANTKNPETGLMENRPSPGKVMLIVETGVMLGLHPMAALQGIDVIEGHPTLKPALMSALIRDAGHTLRITQTGSVEGGDLAVTTTLIRSDDPEFPYVYTWTPFDALRAGLIDSYKPNDDGIWQVRARSKESDKPKPWEAYTARLCRWRSLSDAASAGAEDVLMGMHYTPEELGAEVAASGEVIQVADREPSEDWAALIAAANSKEEIAEITQRAKAAGEVTDTIRTAALTRVGMLNREPAPQPPAEPDENIVDAEEVTEPDADEHPEPDDSPLTPGMQPRDEDGMSEEEWERQSAAEFDRSQASKARD